MYSPKEKEIIERCLSISIWNYRAGKSTIAGKEMDAFAFRGKARQELMLLGKVFMNLDCPTPSIEPTKRVDGSRRISKFFSRLVGRDLV